MRIFFCYILDKGGRNPHEFIHYLQTFSYVLLFSHPKLLHPHRGDFWGN